MQKIYENMELTYVSYVSFNEVFKNTWMVFTMEPHPPKKTWNPQRNHGTPKIHEDHGEIIYHPTLPMGKSYPKSIKIPC